MNNEKVIFFAFFHHCGPSFWIHLPPVYISIAHIWVIISLQKLVRKVFPFQRYNPNIPEFWVSTTHQLTYQNWQTQYLMNSYGKNLNIVNLHLIYLFMISLTLYILKVYSLTIMTHRLMNLQKPSLKTAKKSNWIFWKMCVTFGFPDQELPLNAVSSTSLYIIILE